MTILHRRVTAMGRKSARAQCSWHPNCYGLDRHPGPDRRGSWNAWPRSNHAGRPATRSDRKVRISKQEHQQLQDTGTAWTTSTNNTAGRQRRQGRLEGPIGQLYPAFRSSNHRRGPRRTFSRVASVPHVRVCHQSYDSCARTFETEEHCHDTQLTVVAALVCYCCF